MTGRRAKWTRAPLPMPMPGMTCWQREASDGHLSVVVGRDPAVDLLWHLSISHRLNLPGNPPGRYPTWDEVTDARYRFVPDQVTMAMFLPPRAEYVNVHPTVFHLWQVGE
ncbi:DUF7694 domain-containing protein [Actinoallomurus sp. CA-142502]|uniref:DUF7694 domain-containing protein n=1 Tax=Actinoallomurus sp. CA-142502 TaxID=3239885 RepID=UPI003D8DC65A